MAKVIFDELKTRYPNSFNGTELDDPSERYGERDAWYKTNAERDHFESWDDIIEQLGVTPLEADRIKQGGMVIRRNCIDIESLNENEMEMLKSRPKGALPPRRLQNYGTYNLLFLLDFGSYRDLQRHRNGICQIPVTDGRFGMFPWYLHQLADLLKDDYKELREKTEELFARIRNLEDEGVDVDPLKSQYLFPMGTAIACHLSYSLPQMVYVSELRSQKTVHGSLRPIAQLMGQVLKDHHPGMALYLDWDSDTFSEKRGTQTIAEQPAANGAQAPA